MLYIVFALQGTQFRILFIETCYKVSKKKSEKSGKICLKTLILYMILHFRVASLEFFYLQKLVKKSTKKYEKV